MRPVFQIQYLSLCILALSVACGGAAPEARSVPVPPTSVAPIEASAEPVPGPEAHEPAGPVETARALFAAIAASDASAALVLVAPERRERIEADEVLRDLWLRAWSENEIEVTDEVELSEDGTTAHVTVRNRDGRISEVRFGLIDGTWYLNEN